RRRDALQGHYARGTLILPKSIERIEDVESFEIALLGGLVEVDRRNEIRRRDAGIPSERQDIMLHCLADQVEHCDIEIAAADPLNGTRQQRSVEVQTSIDGAGPLERRRCPNECTEDENEWKEPRDRHDLRRPLRKRRRGGAAGGPLPPGGSRAAPDHHRRPWRWVGPRVSGLLPRLGDLSGRARVRTVRDR